MVDAEWRGDRIAPRGRAQSGLHDRRRRLHRSGVRAPARDAAPRLAHCGDRRAGDRPGLGGAQFGLRRRRRALAPGTRSRRQRCARTPGATRHRGAARGGRRSRVVRGGPLPRRGRFGGQSRARTLPGRARCNGRSLRGVRAGGPRSGNRDELLQRRPSPARRRARTAGPVGSDLSRAHCRSPCRCSCDRRSIASSRARPTP